MESELFCRGHEQWFCASDHYEEEIKRLAEENQRLRRVLREIAMRAANRERVSAGFEDTPPYLQLYGIESRALKALGEDARA